MRSASASASAMSCVQSRIVASCVTRTSRMNSCTSSFERGSRPVVGSSSRSSTGDVRSARASATFCCMPRDRFSIASRRRSAGKPTFVEDLGDLVPRLRRRHSVEARRVREVLGRGHLLEEARLDGDAVHELPDRTRLVERVVPEDARLAAVVDQERREQADERRLARAVLAENRDALAAFDRERHVLERRHPPPREAARAPVAAAELLRQVRRPRRPGRPDGRMALLVRVLQTWSCCCSFENEKGNGERGLARGGART